MKYMFHVGANIPKSFDEWFAVFLLHNENSDYFGLERQSNAFQTPESIYS